MLNPVAAGQVIGHDHAAEQQQPPVYVREDVGAHFLAAKPHEDPDHAAYHKANQVKNGQPDHGRRYMSTWWHS